MVMRQNTYNGCEARHNGDETMHNIMKILKSAKKDPNNLSQKLFEILLLSIQDHLDKVMTYH